MHELRLLFINGAEWVLWSRQNANLHLRHRQNPINQYTKRNFQTEIILCIRLTSMLWKNIIYDSVVVGFHVARSVDSTT